MIKLSVFYDHVKDAARQSGKDVETVLRACRAAGITAPDINNETVQKDPAAAGLRGLLCH